MLEASWAQSTDADTGMGPFPGCAAAAAVAQGKLRAAVQGCSLEKVRLAERSRQENAPSPGPSLSCFICSLTNTGSRAESGRSRDERRWQDWEGPEIPGRFELQRIGLIRE